MIVVISGLRPDGFASRGDWVIAPGSRVVSVNVGAPRLVRWRNRDVLTSIFKDPVAGRVAVQGVNLAGDDQADRTVHGGPDKAVYVYAQEDLDWWSAGLGVPLAPGVFGENLTVAEMAVTEAVIGERWRVNDVVLEVCGPRTPCYKLGIRMGADGFPRLFAAAGRPGAYLRILTAGTVAAGDAVIVEHRPSHGVTVRTVADAYHRDHSRAAELLAAPELAGHWQAWARKLVARQRAAHAG
ncbi:MAG TPA: MOSC domain-containing protein [Pseudonocardiaceae bacterium]|jgi:MOSC domain-containing protein YiiM|nr:MOSC domain-containing protein [Pseudonocardiaceae bacterium]